MSETEPPLPDPLGVRAACRLVLAETDLVQIDLGVVALVAGEIAASTQAPPEWDSARHWSGSPAATANWLLALDAANFCFWGEPRWQVTYRGRTSNGYWALVDAFVRAEAEGRPLHDAAYLVDLTIEDATEIFRGEHKVPLFEERVRHLREAGHVLLRRWDGQFLRCVEQAEWRAPALAGLIADEFSSFRDVAHWSGRRVPLLKRAQILATDVHGALGDQVDRQHWLQPGSPEEVAIRAGTVGGVDELSLALRRQGRDLPAYRVDWYLWTLGQALGPEVPPYHRTLTTAY